MPYEEGKSRWAKQIRTYGDEEKKKGVMQLVYGEFGVGKTFYCASSPGAIVIDIDRGENIKSRENALNYFYFKPEGLYDTLKSFLRDVQMRRDVFSPEGPLGYIQTLVLDSWTKINESLLIEIAGEDVLEDSKPGWDAYMTLKSRQIFLVKILKEIAFEQGINVLVTALPLMEGDDAEKLKRDEKKVSVKAGFNTIHGMPNLVGAFKKQIGAEFDEVYYLESFPSGGHHNRLWTVPHNDYHAKSRNGITESIIDATFDKVLEAAAKVRKGNTPGTKP